jgi:alpha-glucosidase
MAPSFVPLRTAPDSRPEVGAGFRLALGGHTLSIEPWGDRALDIRFEGAEPLPYSPAVLEAPATAPLVVTAVPGGWRVATASLALRVQAGPLSLAWETPEGLPVWGPVAVGTTDGKLTLSGALLPQDGCFGLGEKPGYLDRRGRAYTMWNTDHSGIHSEVDDKLYQSIPFLLTRHEGRHAGFLFDDPGRTRFDLGATDPAAWRYEADGPGLRLYAVAGPAMAEVVAGYADLTGRMALPPLWALGFHQSRWSYPSREAVEAIAHEFRDRRIPADVIHLDIDYMDAYKVFTWSPERFPNPAGMLRGLRDKGFRAVTIVDPGVKAEKGYAPHDEAVARGLVVRNADGTPLTGKVWPGDCVFPDFTRPDTRAWWGDWHAGLLEAGIAGIWCDMNEPSLFKSADTPYDARTMPDDARHGEIGAEVPHRAAHNLYGFGMSQATRDGLSRLRPDERPFVISRAGYAGIQRHAMVWTGDNQSMWSHLEMSLPMNLNLGLSGVAFVGPDVGGFGGDCTAELLVRWTQAGAFTPFFRNHSALGTRHQEPWAFGPEAEALCREAIGWRYRLLPYLYGLFRESAETGLPIMRPMAMAYPAEPAARGLFDQYMLGGDLLVAPVTRPQTDRRMVYFPAGRWEDWLTGEVHEGPGFRVVPAPLDRIPAFIRGGAALPVGPVRQHTGEPLETLTLRLGPSDAWTGTWYDDDGETLAHQAGGYALWRFTGQRDATGLSLALSLAHDGHHGPTDMVSVEVAWTGPVGAVTFSGAPLSDWRLEGDRLTARLPLAPGTLRIN